MIQMIIQTIGAFFSVLTLSVIFGVPKKYLVYSSFTGALGWWAYLMLLHLNWTDFLAMFGATVLVALASHIFARVLKSPVSIYLIPGILPLVPGLGMYRTVYHIMREETSLAGEQFLNTMQIAGMIALAIFFVDTFFRAFRKKCGKM